MKTFEQQSPDKPKQELLDELDKKHFGKLCALHTAMSGVASILTSDNFDTSTSNLDKLRLVGYGLQAILDDYSDTCSDYIETMRPLLNQYLKG